MKLWIFISLIVSCMWFLQINCSAFAQGFSSYSQEGISGNEVPTNGQLQQFQNSQGLSNNGQLQQFQNSQGLLNNGQSQQLQNSPSIQPTLPSSSIGSTLRTWPISHNLSQILVTTTSSAEGYTIKRYLGLVRGMTVRQPSIQQNLASGFQRMLNVNLDAYAEMCDQAREEAFQRMLEHALSLGANAVIAVRYDSTPFSEKYMQTEVFCYGTAVIIEPNKFHR